MRRIFATPASRSGFRMAPVNRCYRPNAGAYAFATTPSPNLKHKTAAAPAPSKVSTPGYHPFSPLSLFEDAFFAHPYAPAVGMFRNNELSESVQWNPRLDVTESKDSIVLQVELPGLSKADVKLSVKDGILSISGERKKEKQFEDDPDRKWHRVERVYGSFLRRVNIGKDIKVDSISAKFNDGVLAITVPKQIKPPQKKSEEEEETEVDDPSWNPRMDVTETKDSVVLHFELPGLNDSDVKLSIKDGILTVRGVRKREGQYDVNTADRRWHRIERIYGSFSRKVNLGMDVDMSTITRKFTDGVLHIAIPKQKKPEDHEVEIQ